MTHKTPTLYIPHGGGPCFFMEWTAGPADTWASMGDWLGNLAAGIRPDPEAIVVISAHWEEPEFTVTSGANPPLIYDYYGFPDHTYQLRYDAPGSPKLAEDIRTLLAKGGIASQANSERGFDHGVFIPFKLIYPNAVIPIVQLSLKTGLDPAAHIAAGRAIAPLRDRNILIVGSGMSFHNMATMMRGTPTATDSFDLWLDEIVRANPEARDELLEHWSEAPGARVAHPREEHLIPLMVAAGAAGPDRGHRTFHGHVMNATVSGFQFGG